jgi:hypothetical protein
MELIFVKRSGKYDDLTIIRSAGDSETIACPKQGIIPHDMVHYAVESVLAHRGFFSLVKAGQELAYATGGDATSLAVERLVETFQAEMWGGRVAASDLLATYAHACEARGHDVAAVSLDDVTAIRERLDALTQQWSALAIHESLRLSF